MKVAYLAFSERLGGKDAGFFHSAMIAGSMAKKGVEVEVFIQGGKGKVEGVKVFEIKKNLTYLLKNFSKIKNELKKADVIHERYSVNPFTYFLQKGLGKKYVLEMNDPGIETWHGLKRVLFAPLIKMKLQNCDAIVTQTQTLKKILQKQTSKPIYVVPNAAAVENYNLSQQQIAKEREKFAKPEEILIVFLGSFREWHGVLEIPGIAERVLEKNKSVKFLLIGKGKEFEKVKNLVKEKNLESKIFLAGAVDFERVPVMLLASDICIAPFNTKNFPQMEAHGFWFCPIKLYDYMAVGKAVVSFEYSEIKNILNGAALLAKPNDLEEFAEMLNKLIKDKNLRIGLGKKAREIALKNTWKQRALETIEIYKKVLG